MESRTLGTDSGWNDEALQGVFLNGLGNQIKEGLMERDDPGSLDSLISLATRMDNHLWECQRVRMSLFPLLTTFHTLLHYHLSKQVQLLYLCPEKPLALPHKVPWKKNPCS